MFKCICFYEKLEHHKKGFDWWKYSSSTNHEKDKIQTCYPTLPRKRHRKVKFQL